MNVNTLVITTLAGVRPLGMRGEPLHLAHDQIRGAIRRRLGERYARLLAEPVPYDGGRAIDWHTDASGPVQAFADLPAARQQALLREVDGLLGDIEALARRFAESGNEDGRLLAQALGLAVRRPSDAYLFLVGDQPVIACWGYEPDAASATLPPAFTQAETGDGALPPPYVAAAADVPAGPRAPVIITRRQPPARRWWPASAAAGVLLVGSAWAMSGFPLASTLLPWAGVEEPPLPAPAAIAVTEQHVRLSATLAQYRARESELAIELASLQERARRELELCRAPPPPSTPATLPRSEEARDAGPPSLPPAEAVASSAATCPPPRRAGAPPPQLTIVMDGASGMNLPSGFSAQHEEGLMALSKRGDRAAVSELKELLQTPGPKRLDDVKQAATQVIPKLPPEVRVGFVVFDDCRAIQDFGQFAAADRPKLLALIQDKAARGGTPLARAIETASSSLRSANDVIVVFSDGKDTCGGNVCAVAQRLHAAKPGVKVHLIDVAGSAGNATCLATITGGRIYSATNAPAAVEALSEVTASFQPPPHCRPRN